MLVVVTLRDGRELTILKANAAGDASKLRDELLRWREQNVVVSLATHQGLFEISSGDIADIRLIPRNKYGAIPSKPKSP